MTDETRTSDATFASRPLFSHNASAEMEDSDTLDAAKGHTDGEM